MEKCDAGSLLERQCIKKTGPRLAVLRSIIANPGAFTASELHESLPGAPAIDLATVYRIIKLLVAKGLLREIAHTGGLQYFELACEHHPAHPHFFCLRCHRLLCLEELQVDNQQLYNQYKRRFALVTLSLNLQGICATCRARQRGGVPV